MKTLIYLYLILIGSLFFSTSHGQNTDEHAQNLNVNPERQDIKEDIVINHDLINSIQDYDKKENFININEVLKNIDQAQKILFLKAYLNADFNKVTILQVMKETLTEEDYNNIVQGFISEKEIDEFIRIKKEMNSKLLHQYNIAKN